MRRLASIILSAALLAACGKLHQSSQSAKSGATDDPWHGGMTVADDTALPPCDDAHAGDLVYVKSTKSFKTCDTGQWAVIDLKGDKGDKGDAGETSEFTQAFALYKTYKGSVFRATLQCTPITPYPSGCPLPSQQTQPSNPTVYLGSAFLCGPNQVCTNTHVTSCPKYQNSACFTFGSLSLQALAPSSDSVDTGTGETPPFFTTNDATPIKYSKLKDLALVTVTAAPAGATALPLNTKAATDVVQEFSAIMSLSFPLGFEDLYADVGHINLPKIGECDTDGGVSGYGCPRDRYDFSTSNDTDHGSSGSPLFDVASGTVVGVTTAGTEGENANYTWAIDASSFSELK